MKKLAKAQMGKIVKSVAKKVIAPVIKKRSWENVSGAAATVGAGLSGAAAYNVNKAHKQFEAQQKTPEAIAEKKKYEDLKRKYNQKKSGGQIKSKKK